ncbi:hypothetical protein F511_28601 [Dorcoceras hygrometricum]|uniref:Uncharacterized protein n=1 Tax=Dorcoceras hygrometricum TaxID=472368 RepID=A0A2Z7C4X9_9LAMI|nr:hypothetical protein F511_28601 [Dorcoceras hygrometricum]
MLQNTTLLCQSSTTAGTAWELKSIKTSHNLAQIWTSTPYCLRSELNLVLNINAGIPSCSSYASNQVAKLVTVKRTKQYELSVTSLAPNNGGNRRKFGEIVLGEEGILTSESSGYSQLAQLLRIRLHNTPLCITVNDVILTNQNDVAELQQLEQISLLLE